MRVDVLWTQAEWPAIDPQNRVAIVVDVLRSTSTIATALANGARAILPAASTEDALQIARSLGRDGVLLCGERRNVRIEGFDLGNSPAEFGREVVGGRTLVMCTTNGTNALLAASGARAVYVASFLNLGAVLEELRRDGGDPVFVCAGRSGLVGLDDVLCAGAAVARLTGHEPGKRKAKGVRRPRDPGADVELGDGALAAQLLWLASAPIDPAVLRATGAGRQLEALGMGDDVAACAEPDVLRVVPVLENRKIVAKRGGAAGRSAGAAR
ncbi:MAG: 2-phosphosulfolactate phosphatase [Gemmatimonadota bacterium]